MKAADLLYQIIEKDNWEVVDLVDGFIAAYDRFPKRMRLVVGYRLQGLDLTDIERLTGMSRCSIRVQLSRAKKRLARLLFAEPL
jgi:hypothetical protein